MICPACQTPNPDHAKFCMNCGAGLTAADARRSVGFDLDRYIPPELAAKLESARAHGGMLGERRVITILFCDIQGSTAAAGQLDPEQWTEIVNGAFERMVRPVYRYEGVVPRLMGDAILAFFGAPIAHEDDPRRALLAALEIQSGIGPYCDQVFQRNGVNFKLRVGVHTGLVVVGEIGSDLRLEYTAIGDAINLAARMEQTAEPGTIQVSEETHTLTAPFFEFEALGGTQVKGKPVPVRTFRVLAAKEAPGRLRGLEGQTSPLVGREAELALLEARLRDLAAGQGAVVSVTGEAGLGKTSLLAEARRRVQGGAQVHWLEGHALSYARSISYFVWRQIVRQSIGARESDAPADCRDKLQQACSDCALPGADAAFLETMLAVESEESLREVAGVQGEALVQRMTQAVRGYLRGLAAGSPLVVALDDLHWMDAASLELLSNVADLSGDSRVLFVSLSRPEREASGAEWTASIHRKTGRALYEIHLEPLPPGKTGDLLANLLGRQDLPRRFTDLILDKADGNPFFVEELIRSLIETGQIALRDGRWEITGEMQSLSLPATLTGVLGARIDRLPEEPRRVLQIASVIGRSFDARLLASAADAHGELDLHLGILGQAGLIQAEGAGRESGFAFRHALVQDAAYNTLLLKQRRELHGRVGALLEGLHADRVEEFAPTLAHHFHAAGDPRSVTYDLLAGEAAERLYANAEAAIHYGRALESARSHESEAARIGGLFSKYGNAIEQSGRYEQAPAIYEQMRDFARERDDPAMELTALTALAKVYSTFTSVHNPVLADDMLTRALDLADRLGDRDAQTRLNWHLMLSCLFSKRLDRSLEHGERALALARASGHRENLAYVLNDLCRVHTCRGEFDRSFAVIREARELWRSMDNQVMLADSLGSEAEARFNACEYDGSLELLGEALSISERINNLWGQCYDRMLLAFNYFEMGRLGAGLPMAQRSVDLGDEAGLIASNSLRAELAWMYAYCGDYERGLQLAGQAVVRAEKNQPDWVRFPLAAQVRIHLLQGSLEPAVRAAGGARLEPISIPYARYTIFICLANIELAEAQGDHSTALDLAEDLLAETVSQTRVDIPEVMRWKGRALLGLDRLEQARQILQEARVRAESTGSNLHLWPVLADLARVNAKLGDAVQAEADRREARRVAGRIADSLDEIGLRETFQGQARIRALMD